MNADCSERCRHAVVGDIPSVARIHLAAFEGFFLSQLGYRFLSVMYLAFLRTPKSLFIVSETMSGQLVGFAVGALHGQNDRWLALRFLPQFLFAVFPAVVRDPIPLVKRLYARLFDASESPQFPDSAAVLRSIGVLPSARGTGAAASLLKTFEDSALVNGAFQVFLTTDELNNHRALRFYERSGYRFVSYFKQDGQRGMWLMSKNLKDF
jgi:ribosomal protein S18 acetylase RimI-like enzyme